MPSDRNVQFLKSPLLKQVGLKHGWFLRCGGVSSGLFSSLNGKKSIGDPNENVEENRRRAGVALLGDSVEPAHILHQFKDKILLAEEPGEYEGYEASITVEPKLLLSQTTADCGSCIITDDDTTIVGLVHGSWHTLSAKIISKTIAKIREHTNAPLRAALGPMICKDCYEFGPEAAKLFDNKYVSASPVDSKKLLVDLKQMIFDQFSQSGVVQVDDLNICTLEDDRFFSHRRDGAHSGRLITMASLTDVI